MTYHSVHTGPEVDAAVAVLNDVQEIRTEVEGYKNTVVSLAGQVQTDAGNAAADALTASQAASDALDSKNAAYASEQAASGHAANADSARALAVVARNGSEAARDEAWATEGRINQLLSDSEPTIDELRAAIRRIHYGDGPYPSLDLNFVGATMLDPRVTFTRASDATYWDAMGVLRVAQPNEPRFEYDPITGKSLGLLIEEQRTNRWLYSTNLNNSTGTTKSGASIPNGPDEYGWCKFNESTNNGPHFIRPTSSFSGEAGKVYSLSFDAKAGEREYAVIRFDSVSTALNTGGAQCVFNLLTGEKTFQTSGTEGWWHIEETAGGYRLIATVTAEQNGSLIPLIMTNKDGTNNFSYQGEADHGIYIRHIQFEEGSAPSSYIKTEASQVTRAADFVMVDWDDFSSSYREKGFTVAFHAETLAGSGTPRIFSIQGGSITNNSVFTGFGGHPVVPGPLKGLAAQVWKNGVGYTLSNPPEITNKTVIGAVSFQPDKYSAITNDQPISSRSLPSGLPSREDLDRFYLGRDNHSSNHLNGYMRRISFYPRAFNDEQLERLVAL